MSLASEVPASHDPSGDSSTSSVLSGFTVCKIWTDLIELNRIEGALDVKQGQQPPLPAASVLSLEGEKQPRCALNMGKQSCIHEASWYVVSTVSGN